jgi:hypothetical protein
LNLTLLDDWYGRLPIAIRYTPFQAAARCSLSMTMSGNMPWTSFLPLVFVALAAACAGDPLESLPHPAGLHDETQWRFDRPWCEVEIPPLTDCGEFGSVSDIGDFISEKHVCSLGTSMRGWLAKREWESFENVRVCRTGKWIDPPEPGESIARDRPRIWWTHIKVDIPERGLHLWIVLDERTGEIAFHVDAL